MELFFALLAIQTAAALAAGVWLFRRQQLQAAEIVQLREALAAGQTRVAKTARAARGATAEVIPLTVSTDVAAIGEPAERAQRAWNLPDTVDEAPAAPAFSAETIRGLTLGILAIIPALGFAFGASVPAIIACGLAIGAAMMAIGHRPMWRAAAWAGVATAGVWALIGFAIRSAHADATSYSICLAIAAFTGLFHAHQHRVTPGVTMALIMTIATLTLGTQIGMVTPAGIAFGVIVAASAVTGAMSLRLESLFLSAFGASLIGLFVLSGQDSAAIWFTPATAWAGAIFFAIAAVRVPQVGARGVAIAGIGALAPLAAITALYFSHHGLADRYAAAGGFAILSALLAGVIAAAALRRNRGLDALKVTLWVLALAAFIAFSAGVIMALPPALAAPAFALAALTLAAIDLGMPTRAWRAFASFCAAFALFFAFATGQTLLSEASEWPAFLLVGLGAAAPAAILAAAAFAARRREANLSAGFLEAIVIITAVFAANLAVRVLYANGATLLEPISFAEAGAHVAVWLAAALAIRHRARFGSRPVRIAAANTLLTAAVGVMLAAAVLWMTPYWTVRHAAVPFVGRDTFGFLIPALLFLAHLPLWRSRNALAQTRLVLGAGALLLAAFITVEVTRNDGDADWLGALVGALSFAAAIGVNFIPALTGAPTLPGKFPSQLAPPAAH